MANVAIPVNSNITGNIGSCETTVVQAPKDIGAFYKTNTIIVTNSCSGQIIQQYDVQGFGWAWIPLCAILFFCALFAMARLIFGSI